MRSLSVVGLLGLLALPASAQVPAAGPTVEIAPFPGGHAGAITYTFDDGLQDQLTIAAPMLEARGMRGTFYIIAGKVVDTETEVAAKKVDDWGTVTWTRLKEIAAKGHEIGSHSWSHPNLNTADDKTLAFEIGHADEVLKQQIGYFPLTIAYPGNGGNDHVQTFTLETHLADRNGGIFLPQPKPGQAANLGQEMDIIGFGGKDFSIETADDWADRCVHEGKWGVAIIHGIVSGYSPMANREIFSAHLDYVKALGDRVWVDTFANVAGYLRMRAVGKIKVTARTDRSVTFTITADLPSDPPGRKFPVVPLTIRIGVPGAQKVSAGTARKKLPHIVQPNCILVTTKAGPEPITVSW